MNVRWGLALAVIGAMAATACVGDEPGALVTDDDGGNGGNGDGGGSDGGNDGGTDGSTLTDGSSGTDGAIATAPPTHAAKGVAFVDIDPRDGTVGGLVRITKADDESDVAGYAIYAADDSGAKKSTTPLGTVPANGKNVVYSLADGATIGAGVTKLVVLTQNAAGEMAAGPTTRYADATVHANALTPATTATPFGAAVSVTFDSTNHKLLVLAAEVLYHCDLDGTNCTSANIGGGRQFVGQSRAFFVPSTTKIVFGVSAYSSFNPAIITTTLDGVASPLVDITTTTSSANALDAFLDTGRGRLILVDDDHSTDITAPTARDVLYDCAYDGTGCTRRFISDATLPNAQGANAGQTPSLAFDATNNKYIVVSTTGAGTVFALVCPTSSGACTGHDAITGAAISAANAPHALVDTVNKKLIVTAYESTHSPVMAVCNLDATGCTAATEMTTGTGLGEKKISSGFSSVYDSTAQKVVAAGNVGGFPSIYRCNPDATGCEFRDMPQSSGAWGIIDVATDPESGQPYVAATTNGAGAVPWLFTMY